MEKQTRIRFGITAIVVAALVIATTTTFFMGRREGADRAAKAEAVAAQAQDDLRAAIDRHDAREAELEQEIAGLSHQVALLNANAALARAVLHLEDRNFGLAEAARRESLAYLRGAGELVDPWPSIRDGLAGIEVTVAEDLQGQRATLRRLFAEMNTSGEDPIGTN